MTDFPVFNLTEFESANTAERELLGAQLDDICRSTGFLAISGPGAHIIRLNFDSSYCPCNRSPQSKTRRSAGAAARTPTRDGTPIRARLNRWAVVRSRR